MSHVEVLECFAESLRHERTSQIEIVGVEDAAAATREPTHNLTLSLQLVAARGPSARSRAAESYRRAAVARACAILRSLAEQGRLETQVAVDVIRGVGRALDQLATAVAEDDVYGEVAAIEDAEAILNALPI